jgi:hypothetical protein
MLTLQHTYQLLKQCVVLYEAKTYSIFISCIFVSERYVQLVTQLR